MSEDYEDFFRQFGHRDQPLVNAQEWNLPTVERMYQAFKARIIAELRVTTPELLERAELIDVSDE